MKKRIMILSLCLAGALTVPALALTTPTAEVENAAPIAEDLTLKTYKGVAISSRFAAVDPEGDLVTFQVVDSPARGQVAMDENDPAAFTYTPYEGKKGRDTFTYVAIDAKGNVSKPATVKVNIQKQSTTVSYSDLEGDPAHYAALRLAEAGVYTGRRVGDLYCFEPEGVFSREEFLAMAMTAAGAAPLENVSLTGFYDDGNISAWAKGYVSAALIQGTVEGSPNQAGQVVFNGDGAVTCGQAAVIIDRLLETGDVATPAAFSKETAPAWAYQSAVNMEAVSVLSGGADLSGTLSRGEAAEMLSVLPPVTVYEPEYVPKPPKVDSSSPLDIRRSDDGTWLVDGPWLQRLIANVNFGDYESRNWFDQKLRQSGLFDKLEELGIKDGDIVSLYDLEFEYQR